MILHTASWYSVLRVSSVILRRATWPFLLAISLSVATSTTVAASPLSQAAVTALARRCAPTVDPKILVAVARVESQLNPLALHNNSRRITIYPGSSAVASELAEQWISKGDSVDMGLMQINSNNLSTLGLTVETALDPCRSLNAAAHVLSAVYEQGSAVADRQAVLLIALSRYNTGRTLAGIGNGYAGRVLTARNDTKQINAQSANTVERQLPVWDIWASASAARRNGVAWLIGSQDAHEFLIGAGAQPTGEPHAVSRTLGTAPGM